MHTYAHAHTMSGSEGSQGSSGECGWCERLSFPSSNTHTHTHTCQRRQLTDAVCLSTYAGCRGELTQLHRQLHGASQPNLISDPDPVLSHVHTHTHAHTQEDEAVRQRQEAEARALEARLAELQAKQDAARLAQEK